MQRKPLPIEIDHENLIITFGKAKISVFHKLRTPKKEYHLINEAIYGSNMVCTNPKKVYEEFTKEFDITPKAAIGLLKNLGWKIIAGDFTSAQIFKYCYPRSPKRQIDPTKVKTLHQMKDVVKQALADNQENLVPLILSTGMSPKQIKDSISKSCWKALLKTSYTKVQLLSRGRTNEKHLQTLETDLSLSTSYIEYCGVLSHRSLDHITINRLCKERRKLSDYRFIDDTASLVKDTVMIAEQIGYTVNPKWSYNRWKEEHQIVSRKLRAKEFSDEKITKGVYSKLPKEVVVGENKATLLDSCLAVAFEGDNMGHCVGGYARSCLTGNYVVYHLTLEDGTEATLGCNVVTSTDDKQHFLSYQQCYGKYNARVDTTFARSLIEGINSQYLKEETE